MGSIPAANLVGVLPGALSVRLSLVMGSIAAANLAEVSPGVLSARLKLRPRLSRVMGFIAVANLAEVSPGVPRYLTSPLAVEKDRENGKGQNG